MSLPKLIDNNKILLKQTICKLASEFEFLSVATGYWDIFGTREIINSIKDYKKIRLLIGQEPQNNPYIRKITKDNIELTSQFPELMFKTDLEGIELNDEITSIRETAKILSDLIAKGVLEVKIFKHPRLHAKAYIFGDYDSNNAIGIVGSSNFTLAGLTSNAELNSVEDDYRVVTYKPQNETQEHGHLSWFDELWNSEEAIEWSGDFQKLIEQSPVGDKTYGAYDVYIKTLMEIYPDEMDPPTELEGDTQDVLFSFQNRNAGILINKLNNMKLAILSDSVGLGKTITAGAVIKHYIGKANKGRANIQIIAPASLKKQWEYDLASVLGLEERNGDYNIVSQQDVNAINEIYDYYTREWKRTNSIDLFVIDEAHNLRSNSGARHDAILNLLQQHQDAHILLLTATPINNSLLDIANLIQLASKGNLKSVNVQYTRPDNNSIDTIDFIDAIKRIQSLVRRAEKRGEDSTEILNQFKTTIHSGLRHYLVRSTRQGVEAEGGIIDKTGAHRVFPKSKVDSIEYQYSSQLTENVKNKIIASLDSFEGINPTVLNLMVMGDITQKTMHPLDYLPTIIEKPEQILELFSIDRNGEKLVIDSITSLVPNLLQVIFMLGFAPYKYESYNHKYYGKTVEQIRSFDDLPTNLKIQLTVHNILQITWLKRLESSTAALLKSVDNYLERLHLFEKYLDKGFIVSLSDALNLDSNYQDGEDIESAFEDYDQYLKDKQSLLESGRDSVELKKRGVERIDADADTYNLSQLHKDIDRDKKILYLLKDILEEISLPENDIKLQTMYRHIKETLESRKFGEKILVFSFFADTIKHFENNLSKLFENDRDYFKESSSFITGKTSYVEELVRRFSPISKKYNLKDYETPINFLFATDVLSEGQNLQDAGYLINYDLHWNPVRMIQRNGRINRLGSTFDEVLIGNMKPTDELELYLNLVHRLESKIRTIRNTVGLDQGVLSNADVNPINFIERYYESGDLPELDDDLLAHTDEHILALRKFLGENSDNEDEIKRVKEMPKGKWNYLPQNSRVLGGCLVLTKVSGQTSITKKDFDDLFFIEVDTLSEHYSAKYLEIPFALDKIKTVKEDNEIEVDNIQYDRKRVYRRAKAEATRQAGNPDFQFTLQNRYMQALGYLVPYFDNNIDMLGIITNGVTTDNMKRSLESILREVRNDMAEQNVVTSNTIRKFTEIFNEIQENTSEEKNITDVETLLFYAGN